MEPSTEPPDVYEGEKFYDSRKNTPTKESERKEEEEEDVDPPDVYAGVKFVDSVKAGKADVTVGKVPIGTKTVAPLPPPRRICLAHLQTPK